MKSVSYEESSIEHLPDLFLLPCETDEHVMFQEVIITTFPPENLPLLQPIFFMLLTQSAHCHHFVFLEFLFLLQLQHCPFILFFLPLGVQHIAIPLCYFSQNSIIR